MLTKLPDYIISDCGYPNWNKETENISLAKIQANLWSTSTIWSTKSSNLVKLLPLRETLSDYYMDNLMMLKQNESMYKTTTTTSTMPQQCCKNNRNNNNNNGRQMPRPVNEVLKNGKRKQYQQQKQQQITLDKRRSHRTNSLADNDLDQF